MYMKYQKIRSLFVHNHIIRYVWKLSFESTFAKDIEKGKYL